MKNYTNIYDIDGELIRAAGDTHKWTIEEAQAKIEYYRNKINNAAPETAKHIITTYNNYISNLSTYIWMKMSQMNGDELKELLAKYNPKKATEDEIKTALEDINDTETTENTANEVSIDITGDNTSNTNEESGNDEAVGRELSDVHEERPLSQSDLLVERDNVNTIMDEVVTPVE